MIERYTRPEMGAIWTDEARFQTWLDVEIAVVAAQVDMGTVPAQALAEIKQKAKFNVERIKEIEAEVKHDVIAFLTNVNENVGDAGRYIHRGMTSSDVIDTSLALTMIKAARLIEKGLQRLHDAILLQAKKHKNTITIGRPKIERQESVFCMNMKIWYPSVIH